MTCRVARLAPRSSHHQISLETHKLLRLDQARSAYRAPTVAQRNHLRRYAEWAEGCGLRALPATPDLVRMYSSKRLVVDGVDTSTFENEVQSVSLWHKDAMAALGRPLSDPTKDMTFKWQGKKDAKFVKKEAAATTPLPLHSVVAMINACSEQNAFQFHSKVALIMLLFGVLRRRAASYIELKRDAAGLLTDDSGVRFFQHGKHGLVAVVRIAIDKVAVPGRPRFIYICRSCGIDCADVIHRYLSKYRVPSGYLLAAPTGKNGTSFRPTPYTAWSDMVVSAYKRAHADVKPQHPISAYSVRKAGIQTAYTMLVSETMLGEFAGWASVKTTVLKHYANANADQILDIVANFQDNSYTAATTARCIL